jgi:hypothetical protein
MSDPVRCADPRQSQLKLRKKPVKFVEQSLLRLAYTNMYCIGRGVYKMSGQSVSSVEVVQL